MENIYKNIYYSIHEDCDENDGGYFVEFFKIIDKETENIDFDNRIDYTVIHANNKEEMKNTIKFIENYIDNEILGGKIHENL